MIAVPAGPPPTIAILKGKSRVPRTSIFTTLYREGGLKIQVRAPPDQRSVFLNTTEGGQLNLILDLVAAVSQLEQARVDQTAVVPGSYGPSPCPNVTALVHFGIAAFFFVAGSREPEFPRTLPYYLADNCAWL